MTQWTLEKAKNGFSEVVRRALAHELTLVTRNVADCAGRGVRVCNPWGGEWYE